MLTAPWASPVAFNSRLGSASRTGQRHAMNHFVQGSSDRGLIESAQKAVESRVIRNGAKPESAAQFGMFGQSHFGFPIGPVLVAHEAQDSQQLQLRELVFAKASAIAWNSDGGHIEPPVSLTSSGLICGVCSPAFAE
jgi:hypothetical protein